MTGQRLFFLFVFPCAKNIEQRCSASSEHFQELELFLQGGSPDIALLTLCFPKPVKTLRNYAKEHGGIDTMWSYKTVESCWMTHKGETPVEVALVTSVDSRFCFFGEHGIASNTYNLKLQPGDKVVIHNLTVIKKLNKRYPNR